MSRPSLQHRPRSGEAEVGGGISLKVKPRKAALLGCSPAGKCSRGKPLRDVLASVVKEQPAVDRVPAQVRAIIARCLQKYPWQRWQAIGDVRIEIEAVLANKTGDPAVEGRGRPSILRLMGLRLIWIRSALSRATGYGWVLFRSQIVGGMVVVTPKGGL
jgi:hypothetical protein